jgi:HTH-type transcriptional regulator/antitoxin HigA
MLQNIENRYERKINNAAYGKLLTKFLPGVIETEEENERALEIVNQLMNKGEDQLSPEETKFFRLLVRLIEDFEEKAYPEVGGSATPAGVLRTLMDEHGLAQKDLAEIFGSQGTLSQVLNEKRAISKTQAKKLAAKFHLPIEVFI